ncbi:hypothetical protein CSUI_000317 [Cystoisospora suis]|uniref:Uncharacterized protein n=1 Tax=Cystoisospora suis TaxID=483139 RepID=A0A2C6LHE6_9APIC|nr:hypothetical protein CSUI_000317 [Cystoisospora suis]
MKKKEPHLSSPLSSPNTGRLPHERKTNGWTGHHLRIAWRLPWRSFHTVVKRRRKRRCVSIHKEEDTEQQEEKEEIHKNERSDYPASSSSALQRNEEGVEEDSNGDSSDHELPPRLIDGEDRTTGGKVDLSVVIEFSDWLESLLFHKTFIEPNEWRLFHLHFFLCQQIPWPEGFGCTYTSAVVSERDRHSLCPSMVMETMKEMKMISSARNLYRIGPLPISVSFAFAMERLLKESSERKEREEEER